jgi:hypothetical protein
MSRHDDVHADVRKRAGEGEHEERRPLAGRDCGQPAGGEQAADDQERPAPVPRRVASVAPATDEERHGEPGRRVDHHHETDQGRRLSDVRQQEREIGRRHGAHEAGADGRRCEDEQVGEASLRPQRKRENAR